MFNKQDIKQLQADSSRQGLDIHHLINRTERLELTLDVIKRELTEIRQECRKDYNQLSDWDDLRRTEIRALADAAGLEIRRGTHLVPVEDEE